MKENYDKAEKIVRETISELTRIIGQDGEGITCYYSAALDKPISDLIDAKIAMAVAESKDTKK